MAGEFQFPQTITFDGIQWRLIYSPNDTSTIPPNLEGSQILGFTCDPVNVPGRPTPIFIAIVDILFPARRNASGGFVGERRLRGFRTFQRPPYGPQDVKPNECVYYIAEGQSGSSAQRFFDALIGVELCKSDGRADASWCADFASIQGAERGQCVDGTVNAERGTSNESVPQSGFTTQGVNAGGGSVGDATVHTR